MVMTLAQCWLQVDGEEGIYMSNGDLVVISHGASHILADTPTTTIRPLVEVLEQVAYVGEGPLVYGGDRVGCCIVCGEFAFDDLGSDSLLESLPKKLHVLGDSSYNTQWLDSVIGENEDWQFSPRSLPDCRIGRLKP
jgi:AraC family transcriptional activator of mtrCDE